MERTLTGCTKAEPMMKTRMKVHSRCLSRLITRFRGRGVKVEQEATNTAECERQHHLSLSTLTLKLTCLSAA